jgi:DGQHR domain-containing protein
MRASSVHSLCVPVLRRIPFGIEVKNMVTAKKKTTTPKKTTKPKTVKFPCIPITQGKHTLYLLSASAKVLWSVVKINERDSDKDAGYQRVLSPSRLRAITKFIQSGKPVPNSVLISFKKGKAALNAEGTTLIVDNVPGSGWIIDGQHRMAGAHQATLDIELPVVAFLGLDLDAQVEQFVTINREAKGVPTSLYYDLLKRLPTKTAAAKAQERAADLANELKKDEDSPFFGRIVVTTAPVRGEISLNNFVRKVAPHLADGRALNIYNANEQAQILNNYFAGLRVAFPDNFNKSSIFFQTIGFGALMNALPIALALCVKHYQAFKISDVGKMFHEIKHFDFSSWEKLGTGTAAENQAAEDLKSELRDAFDTSPGGVGAAIDLG